jgi:acetyltransferase-like isoleucine patch superfamily enzyme
VSLNGTSIVARSKTVYIGEATMVAPNVTIMDSDFHPVALVENRVSLPGFSTDDGVRIGRNCWIGTRAIILKGVEIGDNSIVAAGSIVSRDIPAGVLAAGSPARVVRPLGDLEISRPEAAESATP